MFVADTCVIIWDALQQEKLSKSAKKAMESAKILYCCHISLWEIALLNARGRISLSPNYKEVMEAVLLSRPYHLIGMDVDIAELSVSLPSSINQNPADRIIAATALSLNIPLITADENLRASKDIETIW